MNTLKKAIASAGALAVAGATIGVALASGASAVEGTPHAVSSLYVEEYVQSGGYINVTLPANFDQAVVTGADPINGPGSIVSVTLQQHGDNKATLRVWVSTGSPSWQVKPAPAGEFVQIALQADAH